MILSPEQRKGVLCSFLVALILSSNHYCRDAPGTVEEQLALDPHLEVSPRRYAVLTAMYFTPSTFVPLGLGLLSNVWGVPSEVVFLCCAWIGVAGNSVAAVGAASGSFAVLLAGRGIAGTVYEAIDMMPLGFIPRMIPGLWATCSGLLNGILRLGSVAAFVTLPRIYEGGGGDGGGGTLTVFFAVALVGSLMGPLATVVWYLATGRADWWVEGGRKGRSAADDSQAAKVEDGGPSVDGIQQGNAEQNDASRDGLTSALKSVPRTFWLYASGGMAMYTSVIPFWFYGSGFLQRSRGFTLAAADSLMVFPEGAICILSAPTGILVNCLKLDFAAQQRALGVATVCIALSHILLAVGAPPSLGVVALGSSYAVSNQLLWSVFPDACPSDMSSLGAGVMACLINVGATVVPAIIGTMHESMSRELADVAMLLLLASFALIASAIANASASGMSLMRKEAEGYEPVFDVEP